ncbi:MAG: hypothetical protein GWO02_05100 [Gammaproteobacteria bacterium]|nr:hypothetical protein [Gammaproteobacteria bacterium]
MPLLLIRFAVGVLAGLGLSSVFGIGSERRGLSAVEVAIILAVALFAMRLATRVLR